MIEQQRAIKMEILMIGGQVSVNGPLENKIFCFGMLKMAEMAVMAYQPRKVIVPTIQVPADLKGKDNGEG